MGADTPAVGGENKPIIKNDDKTNNNRQHGRRGNNNSQRRGDHVKKEKFVGADPDLAGFTFVSKTSRADQTANFETVDAVILNQIGVEYHLSVLESIEAGKKIMPDEPDEPKATKDEPLSEIAKLKFKEKYVRYLNQVEKIESQLKKCYFKYYGQCDEEIKASLNEDPTFKEAHQKKDVIKLRSILKSVTFHFRNSEEPIKTLLKSNQEFMAFKQGRVGQKNSTVLEYYTKFTEFNKLVEEMAGDSMHSHLGLIDIICREEDVKRATIDTTKQAEYLKIGKERMLAMHFMLNSDQERYGSLIEDYDNDYLGGKNKYPTTLVGAYTLLKNWKIPGKKKTNPNNYDHINRRGLGLSFNTNGEEVEDGDALVNDGKNIYKGPACTRCKRPNHATSDCRARWHADGTMLHMMEEVVEEVKEVEDKDCEVSKCPESFIFDCGDELEELMFLQPHLNGSPTDQQTTSSKRKGIPLTWMLLDSQSTIDVFCNAELLENIRKSDTSLNIRCNAGVRTTDWKGYLPGYGWVWYYPEGIANILSLSRVKERYRVTFDSATDNCFHVHKDNKKILKFREATRRLYYFDTADRDEIGTMLITTVENNKTKLSAYDYNQAEKARSLHRRIDRPSVKDFIRYVTSNEITNCPVTAQDIRNAEFLWGPDLGCLKGKTVRTTPTAVRVTGTDIPLSIMQQYKNVTLSVDVMKVAGIPFLMTISKHIKFGSAGKLDSMKNSHIIKHFKAIIGAYVTRGFKVTIILADNQFESMRGDLADLHAQLNVTARDEHVPEAERYQRTIQERIRAQYNVLPFQCVPPIFIVEMVYKSVFWRNMFALQNGISKTQSPSEIVLNRKLDLNAHCKVEFGEYVQTHEEHDNSLKSRTVGAIATRPSTGNGAYYFISLATGRRINRRSWTSMPMPLADVVPQVHRLARRAKAKKKLTFTNMNGEDIDTLYSHLERDEDDLELDADIAGVDGADTQNESDDEDEDDDDDSDYNESDDDSNDDESNNNDDNSLDGNYYSALDDDDDDDDDEDDNSGDGDDAEVETPGVSGTPGVDVENPGVTQAAIPGVDPSIIPGVTQAAIPGVDPALDATIESDEEEEEEEESDTGDENERTAGGMTLREQPRREYDVFTQDGSGIPDDEEIVLLNMCDENECGYEEAEFDKLDAEYIFLHDTLGWKEGLSTSSNSNTSDAESVTKLAEYLFLTDQMNWKKGLKVLGPEKGEPAIETELQQIHDMEGFQPKHWYDLTKEERAMALKYLMYLKEKRDGKIKGRGCADGRPQRLYTSKVETSSPTASLAGIMLTCMIDAHEKRDVATVDIPGAFLQTKMPEDERDVHVVLDGRMAELLAKIAPETYQEYVHQRRGQSYIYCKLNVALYGTLKAALLFWRKLSKSLKDQGFIINPYDWCIANKTVNGKQCTIVWHVDDLKISHVDSSVVDGIIASLKEEYGQVGEMTVKRGKIHEYLGMTLDFSDDKSFVVDMEAYLTSMCEDLPADMDGVATTPASDWLFKTRENSPKLNQERADLFHRVTAQMLFVSQRGRPDLRTPVSFLTKRVKTPDEDDYKKLARAIKYIRRTMFLKLRIEATYLDQNHWFIDGAFAVHEDMKSHTGGYMTFGRGMIDGSSRGQKINTTSSTEAEVVAVHDNMPAILWVRYFLEAQGYPLKPSIVHQDNQSAMLLETNGRGSSSKRTRHMNIRYFFVGDVKKRNQVTLAYCPTDEMIGDFFTKPLGGAKFRRFRNIVMNISHDEYGPVDYDELMTIHYAKMQKRISMDPVSDDKNDVEPTIKKPTSVAGSQECVEDLSKKRSNVSWAIKRTAHKDSEYKRGQSNKPTYAQIVME